MSNNRNFCEYCGAPLISGANFCEGCGHPVNQPPAAQPAVYSQPAARPAPQRVTPQPSYAYSAPRPPAKKRGSKLPIFLVMGGCLGFLCVLVVFVGAFFLIGKNKIGDIVQFIPAATNAPAATATLPEPPEAATQAASPTQAPLPTQQSVATQTPPPTQAPPTQAPLPTQTTEPTMNIPPVAWPADIGQELSGYYFSDDFSNNQYGWEEIRDEVGSQGLEDGHYGLHLLMPNFIMWVFPPITFNPRSVGFDAAIQPGSDQGAYGVLCYYQDDANYYSISIDPLNHRYSIGQTVNDEYTSLLDEAWKPALNMNQLIYDVNSIQVVCDPDMITLFINNEFENQVTVTLQPDSRTAIYAETWEDTPASGFKVLFDNLYAYIPQQ
jgi:hypothetical protein